MQIFTEEQGLRISNERVTWNKVSLWKGLERMHCLLRRQGVAEAALMD